MGAAGATWNRTKAGNVSIDDAQRILATSSDPAEREQALGAIAARHEELGATLAREERSGGKLGGYARACLDQHAKMLTKERTK